MRIRTILKLSGLLLVLAALFPATVLAQDTATMTFNNNAPDSVLVEVRTQFSVVASKVLPANESVTFQLTDGNYHVKVNTSNKTEHFNVVLDPNITFDITQANTENAYGIAVNITYGNANTVSDARTVTTAAEATAMPSAETAMATATPMPTATPASAAETTTASASGITVQNSTDFAMLVEFICVCAEGRFHMIVPANTSKTMASIHPTTYIVEINGPTSQSEYVKNVKSINSIRIFDIPLMPWDAPEYRFGVSAS